MVTALWSVTGGSGVTVTTLLTALHLSARSDTPVLVVDLDGDVPAAAGGMIESVGAPVAGVAEWTRLGADVRPDSLERLIRPMGSGVEVLPRGTGPIRDDRLPLLAQLLTSRAGHVLCDLGALRDPAGPWSLLERVDRSILVSRCCYLALRRANEQRSRIDGIVAISEPGRILTPGDLGRTLGRPIVAIMNRDPAIARLVDAGLLLRRPPRRVGRLDDVAPVAERSAS